MYLQSFYPLCFAFITLFLYLPGGQAQSVAITGARTGYNGNARPTRRNVADLCADPNKAQYSLFVQALKAMQQAAESSDLSFYGVAGIHGRPYKSWNGVPQAPGAPLTGYCTHDSVLFPDWHRPYLALYEQIIAGYAQTIAKNYTPSLRTSFQQAADALRIPYWDWATNSSVPDCVNANTVPIIKSDGTTQFVANPLQQYRFQTFPLDPTYFPSKSGQAGDWYLATYRNTVRRPASVGAASDYNAVNAAMAAQGLRAATWNSLTKAKTFNGFATYTLGPNSVEAYHGNVHNVVGGNYGHMTSLSYSAFDPIFWLHHANVDRLFALWEAIYPAQAMTPTVELGGTYAIPRGQINTASTPLTPFASDTQRTYFTSTSSKPLSNFGYTYPEINDWSQTPAQLQASVISQVTQLYGAGAVFSKRAPSNPHIRAAGNLREWSASIQVHKYALQGKRFIVRCFLGAVPDDASLWATAESFVGMLSVLPNQAYAGAGPYPEIISYYEISLQDGLARAGFDVGADEKVVEQYLKSNLNWRVQLLDDGTTVDNVDTLVVKVVDEVVTAPKNPHELPQYGKKTPHPGVTRGRAGGFAQ
ncbi:hypothetical protein PVAG01_07312 [Phlyctema vagabunda]|uniref:Tyrosinase copper-binding domain-containing protein n=1 Tax=Phlyctema vagabunda TaxID=108571 RepID=A0ABR4PC11_9HELO